MKARRIVRYLWNFNAVTLALMSVLGIIVLLFVGFFLVRETFNTRSAPPSIVVAEKAESNKRWSYGRLRFVEESDMLVLPLQTRSESVAIASSGGGRVRIRNLLFYNLTSQESHWLFADNSRHIYAFEQLKEDKSPLDENPTRALFYNVTESDSNGSGALDDEDLSIVALSGLKGENYTEILQGVDRIVAKKVIPGGRLFIIYQMSGKAFASQFDLSSYKEISTAEIKTAGAAN